MKIRTVTMMHMCGICPKSAFDGLLTVFVINEYETNLDYKAVAAAGQNIHVLQLEMYWWWKMNTRKM